MPLIGREPISFVDRPLGVAGCRCIEVRVTAVFRFYWRDESIATLWKRFDKSWSLGGIAQRLAQALDGGV
jgi:hypothetical protein